MKNLIERLVKEESGQGMTEYGLIVVLVAVALVAGLIAFRDELETAYAAATTALATR